MSALERHQIAHMRLARNPVEIAAAMARFEAGDADVSVRSDVEFDIAEVVADLAGAGSPDGGAQVTARQLVTGMAGVPLDAYDAIDLCSAGDEPAQILAGAARPVADLWNDPPESCFQRDQVAQVFPELADALDELLGGGPTTPAITWADVRIRDEAS